MIEIEEEIHWHIPSDDGADDLELIANYNEGARNVPLSIIQGQDTVWLSKEQAKALNLFLTDKVLL